MRRHRSTALYVMAAISSSAYAQSPENHLDEPYFRPGIHEEEFEGVVEKLAFDDATTEALFRALYEDFIKRYRGVAAEARAELDAIHAASEAWRREHPDEGWPDLDDFGYHEFNSAWIAQRAALEEEFERDIEALIGPERAATWRRITQGVRRQREFFTLKQHPYAFWIVDLEAILDELDIPAATANEQLNAWSAEFDRAVRRYHDVEAASAEAYRGARAKRWEEMTEEEFDDSISWMMRIEEARYGIGQVSRRWMRLIADALGEPQSVEFVEAVEREAFSGVHKLSPVELLAERLDDLALDATVKIQIRELIAARYDGRQRDLRRRLMRAHEEWMEPKELAGRWRRWGESVRAGQPASPPDEIHPGIPIWIENRQLSLETCRAIRALIPQEEFEALPFSARLWLSWWEE